MAVVQAAVGRYGVALGQDVNASGGVIHPFGVLHALKVLSMEVTVLREFLFDVAADDDEARAQLSADYLGRLASALAAETVKLRAAKILVPGVNGGGPRR